MAVSTARSLGARDTVSVAGATDSTYRRVMVVGCGGTVAIHTGYPGERPMTRSGFHRTLIGKPPIVRRLRKEHQMAQSIREIMTTDPRTVEPSATLTEAARAMREDDVGAVLVVDGGTLAGIVTDPTSPYEPWRTAPI